MYEHKTASPVFPTGGSMHSKDTFKSTAEEDAERKKDRPQFGFESMSAGQVAPSVPVQKTGNSAVEMVNDIHTTGLLTPQDNFTGRSKEKFGVGERINLDISSVDTDYIVKPFLLRQRDFDIKYDNIPAPKGYDPQKRYDEAVAAHKKQENENKYPSAEKLGGFQWSATGGGVFAPDPGNTGKTVYTAPEKGGTVTLNLKSIKSGNIVFSKSIQVAEPNAGYVKRNAATPLWHQSNHVSAGFIGDFYIGPKDVSFSAIQMKEGVCSSTVTGTGGFQPQEHDPGSAGFADVLKPANSTDGSKAMLYDRAQMAYTAARSKNTGGHTIAHSTFTWQIPWIYRVNRSSSGKIFTHARQYGEGFASGKMSVSKADSGLFSCELNDPEFNQAPYIVHSPLP